jgi:hypothetical protein
MHIGLLNRFPFCQKIGSSFEISLFQIKSTAKYLLILHISYTQQWNWLFVIWELSMVSLLAFNNQISQTCRLDCFALCDINLSPLWFFHSILHLQYFILFVALHIFLCLICVYTLWNMNWLKSHMRQLILYNFAYSVVHIDLNLEIYMTDIVVKHWILRNYPE